MEFKEGFTDQQWSDVRVIVMGPHMVTPLFLHFSSYSPSLFLHFSSFFLSFLRSFIEMKARRGFLVSQYFAKLLNVTAEEDRRLLFAESTWDLDAALDLLATSHTGNFFLLLLLLCFFLSFFLLLLLLCFDFRISFNLFFF
jgi:hypothetical protein